MNRVGMVGHLALLGVNTMARKKTETPETPIPENGGGAPKPPTPDADGFIGELEEATRLAVQTIQQQQQEVIVQLGNLEIRKAQLINRHAMLQDQANRVLQAEAARLGIPKGQAWQVTPDGRARLM